MFESKTRTGTTIKI
jgi:hypothetical protein